MIRKYDSTKDEEKLMQLIRNQGDDWDCYWGEKTSHLYRENLKQSIVYVAEEEGEIVGYSRSLEDPGFYVYVCDLLVEKSYRGKHLGNKLMQIIYQEFRHHIVYVMSDVDAYYQTLGYRKEGSIYQVNKPD